jgi:ribose 5-phosphate isomerase RpiB
MLVIIGFVSVSVMRNAASADVVSNNARAQTQANQYAQIAEKFCESQVLYATTRAGHLTGGTGVYWQTFANWYPGTGTTAAHTLSSAELAAAAAGNNIPIPAALPQCMSEDTVIGGRAAYVVTSRGFSLDYRADSKGNTTTGSVVWLQAIVF